MRTVWVVMVLASSACVTGGAGAPPPTGQPVMGAPGPADPCMTASPVPSDVRDALPVMAGVTQGCWTKDNDEHAYALPQNEASGGAGYRLVIETEGNTRGCLSFYDQDRNVLPGGAGGCSSDGAPHAGWVGVAPGTTAYVLVGAVNPPSPRPYRLTVEVVPVDEPPHHDQASATPLQVGEPVTGFSQFLINGDPLHDDYFVVEIAKTGTYEVLVADPAPKARMGVVVLDRDRKQVWSEQVRTEGANLRATWKAKKGTYYLKLADNIGGHTRLRMSGGLGDLSPAFLQPYTLSVTAK